MSSALAHQDIIDADECAALLRCTSEHVEELARKGEIPGFKIGRAWLFVREDLLAYLAAKARMEAEERRSKVKAEVSAPGSVTLRPRRRPVPNLPAVPA